MKFSFYKKGLQIILVRLTPLQKGQSKKYIPNKKLSYTWKQNDVPGFPETVVTWELEEDDANKTRVNLFHSGFTGREGRKSFKEHDQGWSYFMERLEKYCLEKISNIT